MIKAQTGTGKSFGYLLALLDNMRSFPKNPTSTWQSPNLVIVPNSIIANQLINWTRSLVEKRNAKLDNIVRVILSDSDSVECVDLMKPGASHILIATPKGVLTKLARGLVDLQCVQTVIIDEADYLLKPLKKHATLKERANRAKHPLPTMTVLSELRDFYEKKELPKPKMLAISATLTSRTRKILKNYGFLDKTSLFLEDIQQTSTGCPSQIQHYHRLLSSGNHFEEISNLIYWIVQENLDKAGLLFLPAAQSKTEIQSFLKASNIKTKLISELSSSSEKVDLLIASDVDARGLDLPDLDFVIVAGAPLSSDSYVHMAGRVGRMGKTGQVYTLIENTKDFERHIGYISRLSLRSSVYTPCA
jgi:superfamily II DNA/RNA helicase